MPLVSEWQPHARLISNVSTAQFAVVTTTADHDYEVGQYIMLEVPLDYGMYLPQVTAKILSIPTDTSFVTDINTLLQPPFATPATPSYTQANCAPESGNTRNIA